MKLRIANVSFLACIFLLVLYFGTYSFAASSDTDQIYQLLKNKTIEDYDIIETPLLNDQSHFNMNPSDDIKKIDFESGLEGYSIDFLKLNGISENDIEKNIDNIVVKNNLFYFPVKVSNKIVGLAIISKENNSYKVFSMGSADEIVDEINKAKESIAKKHKNQNYTLSYISPNQYLTGFRVKTMDDDYFICTSDSVIEGLKKQQSEYVAKSLKQLKSTSREMIKNFSGDTFGDLLINSSNNLLSSSLYFYIAGGFILTTGIAVYYFRKRKLK